MGDDPLLAPLMGTPVPPPGATGSDAPHEEVRARDLRRLARGSAVNLAGSLVAAVLNLVLPILITRGLTQADAGVFFQTTALFTILLNVGTIGADTGVLRTLPQAMALGNARDLTATMRISIVPAFLMGTLLAIVIALLAVPIGDVATGGDQSAADTFTSSLLVLSPLLPVAVVYLIVIAATRGLDAMRPLVLIEKWGATAFRS